MPKNSLTKRAPKADAAPPQRMSELKALMHSDGFVNTITGIGVIGQDKRLGAGAWGSGYVADILDTTTARTLWRTNWVAAKIVETLPADMYRQGFRLLVPGGEEVAAKINADFDELQVADTFCFARSRARAEGGAVIFLGAHDGQALDQPLNIDRVTKLEWMTVLGPGEISIWSYYENAMEPKFGLPRFYRLATDGRNPTGGMLIHESRVIRFDGIRVSQTRKAGYTNGGWGDSALLRPYELMRDFGLSWASVAIMMQELSIAVTKFKGLAELMATDRDDVVLNRMKLAALSKSVAKQLLLDAEESFERIGASLAGVPEVMREFAVLLASSASMPVTKFLGISPAGLNATGESDLRLWYDSVVAEQGKDRRGLNYVTRILMRARNIREPELWKIKFAPPWQMTMKEQADVRLTTAQADKIEIESGMVTADEAAMSRHGGEDFSVHTSLNLKAREAYRKAEEAALTKAAAGEEVDPETALNGAQVTSMLEIVKLVALGQIPRKSGVQMLTAAFPISIAQAEAIMGDAGSTFVPTPVAAPAQTSAQPARP